MILGKTNLSEWANFRSTRSTSGWSGRGGQTQNPYALDRNPCGSSAGTRHRDRREPRRGRRRHRDRRQHHLPVVGGRPGRPQADGGPRQPQRHHSDLAFAGHRRADGAHRRRRGRAADGDRRFAMRRRRHQAKHGRALASTTPPSSTTACEGARIGVLRKAMGYQPDVDAAMERAIAAMQRGGRDGGRCRDPDGRQVGRRRDPRAAVRIQDPTSRPISRTAMRRSATLAGLIECNKQHAAPRCRISAQELFEQAQAKGPLTDARLPEGARQGTAPGRAGRHRRGTRRRSTSMRWSRRRRPGVADRPDQWRPLHRRRLWRRRRRRDAEPDGADGRQPRPADRHRLHGAGLERGDG